MSATREQRVRAGVVAALSRIRQAQAAYPDNAQSYLTQAQILLEGVLRIEAGWGPDEPTPDHLGERMGHLGRRMDHLETRLESQVGQEPTPLRERDHGGIIAHRQARADAAQRQAERLEQLERCSGDILGRLGRLENTIDRLGLLEDNLGKGAEGIVDHVDDLESRLEALEALHP